jgi:gamma-D-glutamyl-L-lysine dipeptidyl-peptidase
MIEEGADQVAVRLPGGGTGWLPRSHVEEVPAQQDAPTGEELVAAARQFRGVGYLPGGLHGLSYDCSGLVHAVCRRFGLTVPRDASDQLALGADVPVDKAHLGDLMFFTHPDSGAVYHVGFWVGTFAGRPQMLHASQTDWAVVDAPLSERRRDHLSHVRRLGLRS